MDQAVDMRSGFYSLLRWVREPGRDEARNVAVMLIDPDSGFGAVRSAPLSSISGALHTQGILDSIIVSLEERVSDSPSKMLANLSELAESLDRSVQLTPPQQTGVLDPEVTLDALYAALVSPRRHGHYDTRHPSKGQVLDTVVRDLRKAGATVHRGKYIGDFIFDAVLENGGPASRVLTTLSFASPKTTWIDDEKGAGHFLFALEQSELQGFAVVQPPADDSPELAYASHRRVVGWFKASEVEVVPPSGVVQQSFL